MSIPLEADFPRYVVTFTSLNSETCGLLSSMYQTEEADKHKRSNELHGRLWSGNDGDEHREEEGTGVWQWEMYSTGTELRYCRQQ